jgi:hypothetical protein
LAIKLTISAVFGLVTMILTVVLIVAAVMGLMWALRHR